MVVKIFCLNHLIHTCVFLFVYFVATVAVSYNQRHFSIESTNGVLLSQTHSHEILHHARIRRSQPHFTNEKPTAVVWLLLQAVKASLATASLTSHVPYHCYHCTTELPCIIMSICCHLASIGMPCCFSALIILSFRHPTPLVYVAYWCCYSQGFQPPLMYGIERSILCNTC